MTERRPKLLKPQDLTDASRFSVSSLPVFGPNQRKYTTDAGETITIDVKPGDLQGICDRSNAPWQQSYTPGVVCVGHRRPGHKIPEPMQPRVVGYSVQYRVAPLNGTPWIWADLYEQREYAGVVAQFPFRSAEYDPVGRSISGVALLTQDPFLNQGIVIPYQKGASMNPEWTPDEEAQYAKMCNYMKSKYPKLAAYMADPSDGNTSIPQLNPDAQPGNPPANYQAAPEYVATLAENARLRAERTLDALAYEGVRFDRTIELPKMVGMKPEEQTAHVSYMRSNYQRNPLPVGGAWLPVASAQETAPKPEAEPDAPLTPVEAQKAVAYQRADEKLTYVDAVTKVKAERKK